MREALMSILAARAVDTRNLPPEVFALAQDAPGTPPRILNWDVAILGALPNAGEIAAAAAAGTAWALADARARAEAQVDSEAEAARLAFITGGSGQALVYEAKRREAAECLAGYSAGSPPAPGVYPMLDAEVGITKTAADADTADAYEVAEVVAALAAAWAAAGAAIEAVRLGAKRSIAEAADTAAIDTIIAGLIWPSPV